MTHKNEATNLEEIKKRIEAVITKEKSSLVKHINTDKDQKNTKKT
jgi:hypothetical protein